MNPRSYLLIIFFLSNLVAFGQDYAVPFDRATYYSAMSADKLPIIDGMLSKLEKASFNSKNAFIGALLMKKAGLVSGVSNKFSTFKDGHEKLETDIKKDPANAELRFLRLMIQENAPRILNYSENKEEDKKAIVKSYKSMPVPLKNAVLDYCKHSEILVATDF